MTLPIVQSRDKQEATSKFRKFPSKADCTFLKLIFKTGEFINGEIWTAGKSQPQCGCLKWHSKLSQDLLKRNLYWNKIYKEKEGCVYLEVFNDTNSRSDDPKLGLADCNKRRKFVCEVKK
jgi:hypothetical protein